MVLKKGIIRQVIIGTCCVLPLLILFVLSVSQNWVYPSILSKTFSADGWKDLLSPSGSVNSSLSLSLIIALSVAFFATTIGFVTSRLIAYHIYKTQLLLLTYLPFILSPVILAVCLKFYFIKLGLAGNVFGVVFAQLIIAFPYSVIFFTGFWNERIKQYKTVVNTLGGTDNYAFKKVIIPLSKSMLLVCFFQCFLISWFEYGLTSVIGYGKVQTLTVKVYQFLQEANIFYAALSCCLLIIPPIILLWMNKKIIFRQNK